MRFENVAPVSASSSAACERSRGVALALMAASPDRETKERRFMSILIRSQGSICKSDLVEGRMFSESLSQNISHLYPMNLFRTFVLFLLLALFPACSTTPVPLHSTASASSATLTRQ